jgi:hypothetical protein
MTRSDIPSLCPIRHCEAEGRSNLLLADPLPFAAEVGAAQVTEISPQPPGLGTIL